MKIYAAQVPDDSMALIKRIEGKDLWIRAFVPLDSQGYCDSWVKIVHVSPDGSLIRIQANPWNYRFGKYYDPDYTFYIGNYQLDIMYPVQLYTTEELIENLELTTPGD